MTYIFRDSLLQNLDSHLDALPRSCVHRSKATSAKVDIVVDIDVERCDQEGVRRGRLAQSRRERRIERSESLLEYLSLLGICALEDYLSNETNQYIL